MSTSLVLEPGSQLLGRFGIPFKGTWKTLPRHLLPPDVLSDSLNLTIQNGVLKPRAGLKRFSQSGFVGDVKGSFLYISEKNVKIPIAVTDERFYIYAHDWEDRTGETPLTLGPLSRVRMTSFASGTLFHVIMANGGDVLYTWQAGPVNELTVTQGSLPQKITDVIVAFGRVVALSPPYTVFWSETYDFHTWYPLNTAVLMDTADPAIAIKNLGVFGFVIYNEE